MAESAVAFLLQQIATLFIDEAAHLGGFRQELQYIKDELGSMRAFLREAEAKEDGCAPDYELKEWVNQIREVAYDTEYVLDDFISRFCRRRAGGLYGRVQEIYTSIKTLGARHQISSQIKDIKYRVESISGRHLRYKSENSTAKRGYRSNDVPEDVGYDIRSNALLLEEADLVGIDKPKKELISHIVDDSTQLTVVSVLGMGGIGKTTLVKRAYEDGILKRKFSTHAWVTVSQSLHLKELFKSLVQQFYKEIQEQIPPEVESMDGQGLRAFVKDFLAGKSFIVVLDDVWGVGSWDAIKYAFPQGNCRSRVVLTTRIADVASTASKEYRGHIYETKPLSDEESWNLFCQKTFKDNCCPPHLEQVSHNILSKCDGLPLAIVAIAGLLALKDRSTVDEWEMVLCSLGGELEGTGKLGRVHKILLLSYNDLPYHLKICLLYISIYPEDYKIEARLLTRLWIAEGFVLERKGMTSVEVAEGYLNELVNRSLIQVGEPFFDVRPNPCRVHDLLREIILSKSKEHNITTVVEGGYTKWPDNARRLVIHDFTDDAAEGFDLKHLRSLAVYRYTNPFSSLSLSRLLCSGPRRLKVLDLIRVGLKDIPKEVFKLFHLKYLNLSKNPIKVIPRCIGKLHNLEFLYLFGTMVTELPNDILKLGKLRELYAVNIGNYSKNYAVHGFKGPYEIGQLVSLHCLDSIDADNEKVVREIGKLSQLRELGLTNMRTKYGKELCSTLEQLTNLRRLFVLSINEDEVLDLQHVMSQTPQFLQLLHLTGPLEKLPPWILSLQGLVHLGLFGSKLMEDPLQSLQDLPNLEVLFLQEAYEGETLRFRAGGFQKLKKLILRGLKSLRWIMAEKSTMPRLRELGITNCKSVEKPPQGIQNLGELQIFGLYDMSNKLIMELESQESELHRNIAHIPDIVIGNWVDGKWETHYL